RDQTLVTDREDVAAPRRGGDARRLLPPVLKREQPEIGQPSDVVLRRVDPEHPALVPRPVPMIGWRRHLKALAKASGGARRALHHVTPATCPVRRPAGP